MPVRPLERGGRGLAVGADCEYGRRGTMELEQLAVAVELPLLLCLASWSPTAARSREPRLGSRQRGGRMALTLLLHLRTVER
jgi:hypothetical protein